MFMVHSQENADVFLYFPGLKDGEEMSVNKIPAYSAGNGTKGLISLKTDERKEKKLGQEAVDNDERDFPSTDEMLMPEFVYDGRPPGVPEGLPPVGQLAGAVVLPFMPNLIIDIWKVAGGSNVAWATTTIDGTSFSVIERLYIRNVQDDENELEVEMFGRSPKKGVLLMELYAQ